MTDNYDGKEKRAGYCPVHHIKCDEIKAIRADSQKKVPIWVFTIFVGLFLTISGYQTKTASDNIKESNSKLADHIELSTDVLKHLSVGLREVAQNQKVIMRELKLTYEKLPDYEKGLR